MLPFLDSTLQTFPPQISPNDKGPVAFSETLTEKLVLSAYRTGAFPYHKDSSNGFWLWYKPRFRTILTPENFVVSTSLKKKIRQFQWKIEEPPGFEIVMGECAQAKRSKLQKIGLEESSTWIEPPMFSVYSNLNRAGDAMAIGVYVAEKLAGGIYAVIPGRIICGESMFHRESDASKVALYQLCQYCIEKGFGAIDCQYLTPHLKSLGAKTISWETYCELL